MQTILGISARLDATIEILSKASKIDRNSHEEPPGWAKYAFHHYQRDGRKNGFFETTISLVVLVSVASSASSSPLVLDFFSSSALHSSLHVFTSSQQCSHSLRHVKGLLHTSHTLLGRFSSSTPRGIGNRVCFSLQNPMLLMMSLIQNNAGES